MFLRKIKNILTFAFREYGAIDDVDIDLHIDVSFLDVSSNLKFFGGTHQAIPKEYSWFCAQCSCLQEHRELIWDA